MSQVGPPANMSENTELLWLGAVLLLLLLGATTGLCVCCSHPGVKRSKKIYQQRNLKDQLQLSCCEVPGSPRYQNFSKGNQQEPVTTYIDLVATDNYNWESLQKSWEDGSGDGNSSDGNSYENVLICKPRTPVAGGLLVGTQAEKGPSSCPSPLCSTDGEESDYQNALSIHQCESMKAMGQVQDAACGAAAGSPVEDEEPDYVNA